MVDIVSLDSRRPHKNGTGKCLHCRHEWKARAPVDVNRLECPECGLLHGVWYGLHTAAEGQEFFRCECGSDVFVILKSGPMCCECGSEISWKSIQ